jgi:2-polyprenyl-6-methoxyphenol hydroxylase-like FAD-dependent oxidoreductase
MIKNKKILISGAGIGGTTLAYWLKKRGFSPKIVEKFSHQRTGGYKLTLRKNKNIWAVAKTLAVKPL